MVRLTHDPLHRLKFEWQPGSIPPPEVARFGQVADDGSHERLFLKWLDSDPGMPLELATYGTSAIPIPSDPPLALYARITLDLIESTVHASLHFLNADGLRVPHVRPLGKHTLFLPAEARVGRLLNPDLLQRWRRLERDANATAFSTALTLPAKTWNTLRFNPPANSSIRELATLCGGSPAPVTPMTPAGTLAIHRLPDEKRVAIRPIAIADDTTLLPTMPMAMEAFQAFRWKAPDRLFHHHERTQILYRILGRCLLTDFPDAYLDSLAVHPTVQNTPFAQTAPDWIQRTVDILGDKKGSILLASPDNDQAPWLSIALPHQLPRRLLGLVLAHCSDIEPTTIENRPALCIETAELLRAFPALIDSAAPFDIRVEFENAPVVRASLRVHIDADKPEKIDWFELRPEVALGGKHLSEADWRAFLESRIHRTDDGAWHVLDEEGANTLQQVADTLDSHRSELATPPPPGVLGTQAWRLRLLDWLALRRAGLTLSLPPEDQRVLDSLLNFDRLTLLPQPRQLNAQLRDYQRAGYSWLGFLYNHRLGAVLADDMGLGKTLQTIAFLAALHEGAIARPLGPLPHLIVLPPTLLFNWQNEIEHFYPGLTPISLASFLAQQGRSPGSPIVLGSYDNVRRNMDALEAIPFDVVIFDEAQHLKNLSGARAQAMRRLQANFKLCLTGTPLENHAGEFFAIVDLALPGLLGEYEKVADQLNHSPASDSFARARPFVLRRTKEKILKELPPKMESEVILELSPNQKALYTRTVDEVRQEVEEAYVNQPRSQAGIVALTALTRLRQLCVSPELVNPAKTEPAPKIEYLMETLAEIADEGHSALVFSQFIRALDLAEKNLRQAKLNILRLDGNTPTPKRKGLVEMFQKSAVPTMFLISLKTGGAGLNLTRAGYVFHLDPWWNPAVEAQATDRAHRMGQTQKVIVQRLIMKHTVEQKIMTLKKRKQELFERILSGRENPKTGALLTRDDFHYLLA